MWSIPRRRWVTNREKMGILGLPVSPSVASAMGVAPLPAQDVCRSATLAHIMGNSMHFSTVGIVQLVALVRFAKLPSERFGI